MKSVRRIAQTPANRPIIADSVLELHAARLLMLLKLCGTAGRIDGLTKLAKLDFFVRYPKFFNIIARKLGKEVTSGTDTQESSMVRHHYGPWDKRYYHVLAYLESKGLISVTRSGNSYRFQLTTTGSPIAAAIEKTDSWAKLATHMKSVKKVLGAKAGSAIKALIYKTFEDEVAARPMGEVIE